MTSDSGKPGTEPTVHVVDDDEAVRNSVEFLLQSVGIPCRVHASAQDFLASYDPSQRGCLLLDVRMPGMSGLQLHERLREDRFRMPVIILTALDQVTDRIEGLNAGADDYLVKPFDLAELTARIGSVARRYAGNPNPIVTHGPFDIDLAARSVRRDGKPVHLTAREWALFEAFLARPGQLLSKLQLEEKLYAFDAEVGSNTIEVHVSRLRKKLGAGVIETERGLGYRLGRP